MSTVCEAIENCRTSVKIRNKTLADSKGCKSKYLISNNKGNEYYSIDFENCVYHNRQNDTKCDYGIQTESNIFFIELKGSEVKKGIEQLLSTISDTQACFTGLAPKARLIVSKFSKPEVTRNTKQYKDLVKILKHKNHVNDNLVITQNIFTENI